MIEESIEELPVVNHHSEPFVDFSDVSVMPHPSIGLGFSIVRSGYHTLYPLFLGLRVLTFRHLFIVCSSLHL